MRKRLLILLTVCAAIGAFSAPAQANSYLVKYCDRNQGTGLSSWEQISWTNVVTTNSCSFATHVQQTGPLWSGDGTLAGDGRHGGFAWQLNRPGLRIYRYNVTTEGRTGDGYVSFQHCAAGGASCPLTSSQQVASGTKTIDIYPAAGSDKRIEFRGICWSSNPCGANYPDPGGENFDGYFYNLHMWVQDDTGPSVSSTFSSGQWVKGNVSIPTTGSDIGGGVQATRAYFDNNLGKMTTSAASCPKSGDGSYLDAEPCPLNYNPTLSYNTVGNLGDGYHDGCVQTYDANNTPYYSACRNISFYVDNTPPSVPTALQSNEPDDGVADGRNWHTTNDVDLSWTNGAEVGVNGPFGHSGLSQITYDIDPAGFGAAGNPGAVTLPIGASYSALSNLAMPGDGAWDIKITLRDAVGNVSVSPATTRVYVDTTDPGESPLEANGWISKQDLTEGAIQTWLDPKNYAELQSGIAGFSTLIDESNGTMPNASIDVVGDVRQTTLPSNLTEGIHKMHIRPISGAGIATSFVEQVDVKVDLTDPVPAISEVPSTEWSNQPVSAVASGTDALSGMTPAIPSDEIDKGAYTVAELDGTTTQIRGASDSQTVSTDGSHTYKFTAYDVAGNSASKTVSFKIDSTPPQTAFPNELDPNRPARLALPVSDALSGVASGLIEVRRTDGTMSKATASKLRKAAVGDWYALNTTVENGELVAVFPDDTLPDGTYKFQATAFDVAGNSVVTSKRKDGSEMIITGPLRTPSKITAGVGYGLEKLVNKCRNMKTKTKAQKKKRAACVKAFNIRRKAKKTRTIGKYGERANVIGKLTTAGGTPITGGALRIERLVQGQEWRTIANTTSDPNGDFFYNMDFGGTGEIRVNYAGTDLVRGSNTTAPVKYVGRIDMKVTKKAKFGKKVYFKGTVRSASKLYPQQGKLVAIQFLVGKKWRPAVAVARTDAKGNFKIPYRFTRAKQKMRMKIKFRAYVPTELGWPFTGTTSPVRIVTVN